jgi:YbbR domain-containing protein
MLRWISNNYRTSIWALALSVAVWVAAVTSADPDETRALSSAVPVQIVGQDPSLVISSAIPTEVEVTLRAPRSVWDIIEADPQIVRAILDLSGLSDGEHSLDLQIQVNARPVQIVSVAPRTITFTLETLDTQILSIDLSLTGETAIGYQAGEVSFEPLEGSESDAGACLC